MSKEFRTVILLHGYNANEQNWHHVVWGTPPDKPGRIPAAIAVTLDEGADNLFLFGSSIGKEFSPGQWKSSGKYMMELMYERVEELKKFTVLRIFQNFSTQQIKEQLDSKFRLIESPERLATTASEIQEMVRICQEENIQKIIFVSSPDHVSRIMRDALKAFNGSPLALNISVRASATLYTENDGITSPENASIDNVIIVEPRMGNFFKLFPGILNYSGAMREINEIAKKWGINE